ncbi:MAG: methyltransferase domain-containing protein [Ferruginibacter sp.]
MPDFSKRSPDKELLDDPSMPFAAIRQNMKELNFINRHLGGHAITIAGLKQFIKTSDNTTFHIAEIGCGGGDNLAAMYTYLKKHSPELKVQFTGIDINKYCLEFAQEQYPNLPATWLHSDYKIASFESQPQLIFSSLFCHHFQDEDLVFMLQWMKDNATKGFFINDLQRHPIAWGSIKFLSRMFSSSFMVKNDAPLSVLRGFHKNEWKTLLAQAGIKIYKIEWKWAFRFLLTVRH